MTPTLASALNSLVIVALILGNTVIKPSGGFLFHLIVAGLAAIPLAFTQKMPRIVGGTLLAVSLALALARYPDYRAAKEIYRRSLVAVSNEISKTPQTQAKRE